MTKDLYPQEPPTTKYSAAFERCWKAHPVGVKKTAWNACNKAGFTESNWNWLEDYLIKRHKDDVKWLEGKYVPHLSTFINQERWQETYKKRQMRYDDRPEYQETPEQIAKKMAEDAARIEEARKQRELRDEMQKRGIH